MKSKMKFKEQATCSLNMKASLNDGIKFNNYVDVICYGADGNVKWEELNRKNLVTNEGLDYILGVVFSDVAQDLTHYIGLTTASTIAGDSMASGLDEFTGYTGDRQAWTEGGVSSQSINNTGSEASFPITSAETVVGAFMTDDATGTAGTLICGVDFAASRTVANGDTLSVGYTLSAADS